MAADNSKTANEERKARLAAALRANLHRRKAQARTGSDDETDEPRPEVSKGARR